MDGGSPASMRAVGPRNTSPLMGSGVPTGAKISNPIYNTGGTASSHSTRGDDWEQLKVPGSPHSPGRRAAFSSVSEGA